mgnify:CR=1 FL=1
MVVLAACHPPASSTHPPTHQGRSYKDTDLEKQADSDRRAPAGRRHRIAEGIVEGVIAIDQAITAAWQRIAALLRSRPAVSAGPAQARR